MACLRSLLRKEESHDEELGNTQECNTNTMKDIETLSLLMATTFIFWVPLIYFPLFLWYSLFGKARRDELKASRKQKDYLRSRVWNVLNGKGGYVPLQVSNSTIDYSALAWVKTALIIAIQAIPLERLSKVFEQITSCSCLKSKGIPESNVKKHIFIEFNAWEFSGSGSDVLWASIMEALWTKIEFEYSINAVILHRASINLACEMAGDDSHPRTRANTRKFALIKFYAKFILSTSLSIVGIVGGLYFLGYIELSGDVVTMEEDGSSTIKTAPAIISIIATQVPLIGVAITFFKKVMPAILRPPFKTLLRDAKNKRRDFSKDTGFMGIVKL